MVSNYFVRAEAHFLKGLEHMLRESWPDAEREFRESLSWVPDRVSTLTNLSSVLIRSGELKEAWALLDRACRLDPDSPEVALNRGIVCFHEHNYFGSLTHFDRAIALRSDLSGAWVNRGLALHYLGRDEEALVSFDKTIELDANHAEAWIGRGVSLCCLQRHDEALVSASLAIGMLRARIIQLPRGES